MPWPPHLQVSKDISQALKCSPSEQLTAFLLKSFLSVLDTTVHSGCVFLVTVMKIKQGMGWGAGPQHCLQEGSLH